MNSPFEGGPSADAMDLGFGPDPQPQEPDNQGQASGGQIVLSQQQFEQLLAGLGQQRQANDYAAALQGQPAPAPSPDIDFSQLPDPRVDFEAFQSELARGMNQTRAQVLAEAQAQVNHAHNAQRTLDDAWAMMRERHNDVSQYEDIIGMAAQREMDSLRQRGIDPMAVLAANMEQAVDAIATRARATVQRIKGVADDGSNDAGRTDMLGGAGGGPRRPGRQTDTQQGNFVDEIKKAQRELGIY